jgi:hypothetical protein
MAVSLSYCFDYEISLRASSDGSFAGSAVSIQEREGVTPGLLGSTARLEVRADDLHLEALPGQRRMADAWGWLFIWELLFIWYSPLCNLWENWQERRASLKSIRLTVPELGSALHDGQTLRVQLQFNMNTGAGPTPLVDVTLLDDQRVVQRWSGILMRSEPLR